MAARGKRNGDENAAGMNAAGMRSKRVIRAAGSKRNGDGNERGMAWGSERPDENETGMKTKGGWRGDQEGESETG